jgi:hypothetical protein
MTLYRVTTPPNDKSYITAGDIVQRVPTEQDNRLRWLGLVKPVITAKQYPKFAVLRRDILEEIPDDSVQGD